jgi:8-oxo-dGTP pyrophosphatase MutT (NUDIX family)
MFVQRFRKVILSDMKNRRLGAAALILNDEGHVLLVKHSYGPLNWELPGGAAERGESIVGTAVREVREETGLRVIAQETMGVYYDPASDMLHFVFLCRRVGEGTQFESDGEVSEWTYWPPSALPRPISDFTVQRINDALSGTRQLLPVNIAPPQWLK